MILLIKLSAISFLFVTSEPLILIKRFIGFKQEEYDTYGKVKSFIYRMITCALCSGFWIGLIITHSIYDAALVSILSEIILKINNRL
jgi:hypothetical protein